MNEEERGREAWPRSRVSRQIREIERRELALVKTPVIPLPAFSALSPSAALHLWETWFLRHGWKPYPFQRQTWEAFARGESGVVSVPTGSGKTLAALGGPLLRLLQRSRAAGSPSQISLLYVAPLKALARDIFLAIERPLRELDLPFRVGLRTGDTDAGERAKLREALPHILVTTPESLALLTADKNWKEKFSALDCVVIDEWHELLGSKRGSLLELTLARLRAEVRGAQTWALSATLGNLPEAAEVATGHGDFTIVRDEILRETEVRAILPREILPWYGSGGLKLKAELLAAIDPGESTILFTNTRSQAELWHQTILEARPDWAPLLALHHGSLEKAERSRVEAGVKAGAVRLVVATSSLDLGVDFPHVKKVIQIGSVKTVTRALQRSGRAEHRLGHKSQFYLLPTSLFDLVETSAVREALRQGKVEIRAPLKKPIDVLLQFLLNAAFHEGFTQEEAKGWLRASASFATVTEWELDWALRFLSGQRKILSNHPEYRKLELVDGRYRFSSARIARLHRLNIGTIVSESGISIQFLGGKKLGYMDESFVARLRKGDVFQFAGRSLEIVQIRDMVAYVRLAKAKRLIPAVWNGQVLPVSPVLASLVREEWTRPSPGSHAERRVVDHLLALQRERSHVPAPSELLVERWRSRSGHHAFFYFFEGRLVHEGLGHLLAQRFGKLRPNTISVSANDQGLELLSTEPLGSDAEITAALVGPGDLAAEIESALNFPELVKRSFREIARVAGLVQQSAPGKQKSTRQLQMSAGLLYEVFSSYDPENLLLREAREQTRRERLEFPRLERALQRVRESKLVFRELSELSPFSLPLFVERVRSQVSTEELTTRVERLQREMFGGA